MICNKAGGPHVADAAVEASDKSPHGSSRRSAAHPSRDSVSPHSKEAVGDGVSPRAHVGTAPGESVNPHPEGPTAFGAGVTPRYKDAVWDDVLPLADGGMSHGNRAGQVLGSNGLSELNLPSR